MDKLTWSAPDQHGSIVAEGPEGRWRVKSINDDAQVSFHPNLPGIVGDVASADTETKARWKAEWDAMQAHPGKAAFTEAYQKLSHMFGIGNDDVIRAETVEEALMLIEAVRTGDAVLPRAEDQLSAAGFAIKHPDSPALQNLWSRRIGSGSLDVSIKDDADQRSVWVTYHGDGANSWHNLANVVERSSAYSGSVLHNTLPDATRDMPRVVVAHAIAVMEARLARGGRFSKPLGEVLLGFHARERAARRKASSRVR